MPFAPTVSFSDPSPARQRLWAGVWLRFGAAAGFPSQGRVVVPVVLGGSDDDDDEELGEEEDLPVAEPTDDESDFDDFDDDFDDDFEEEEDDPDWDHPDDGDAEPPPSKGNGKKK